MDQCEQCGFVYADHEGAGIAAALSDLPQRYATEVSEGIAADDHRLRRRPEAGVWSALEYACHVRDVLLTQRERLFLALVEDCPTFVPMYREQRVVLASYETEDPAQVAAEIGTAARLLARALIGLDPTSWRRPCIYNFPEPQERTVLWLAQHTLHEGEHHLLDMKAATSATSKSGNSP